MSQSKGKNTRNGKGGANHGARASGEGPDEAVVKGWKYKGHHKELPGGTGEFEYTDRQGEKKVTHRFTLRPKKDK